MPYPNEFANKASIATVFKDKNLKNQVRSISKNLEALDFEEESISFQEYSSKSVIDEFDKVIAIDGSITSPIKHDVTDLRLIRIAVVEFTPDEYPTVEFNETYDLSILNNWATTVTEINIPFLDFDHPENIVPFEEFVKNNLSEVEMYNRTLSSLIQETAKMKIGFEGSLETVCPSCRERVEMESIYTYCHSCGHELDSYTPLRLYNGYQPQEFMTFIENLVLIDTLDSEDNSLIIKDGPLSQSRAPSAFVKGAFQQAYPLSGSQVIGFEKTGRFQSSLEETDSEVIDAPSIAEIPESTLTDMQSEADSMYGERTHFGKRFFICPFIDTRYTIYVPRLQEHEEDGLSSQVSEYEEIHTAIDVVEKYNSLHFENSITPIILANQKAALPDDAEYERWLKDTISGSSNQP